MTKSPKRPPAGLPDKDTLVAFLREAGSAEKTDIARHFGLKGALTWRALHPTIAIPPLGRH